MYVYFVYYKYLGRGKMGIQRYNGKGKTGKREKYLGRDEMDIQRENRLGK